MKLIDLLPEFYQHSPEVIEIQEALQYWADQLEAAKNDLLLQLNIDTATWGLDLWEKDYGIPTDISKSYEYRRTVIKSKIRGVGTLTPELMANVANSFENGDIAVTESPEAYNIDVKFVGTIGLPPNLQDLKDAISNIKPAHLNVTYIFKYLLINQIHNVMTINDIQSHQLTDFAPFAELA